MFGDFLQLLEDGEPVEEGVLEGFLEGHPPIRVVVEHPSNQVQHHGFLLTLPGGRAVPSAKEQMFAMNGDVRLCEAIWMCYIVVLHNQQAIGRYSGKMRQTPNCLAKGHLAEIFKKRTNTKNMQNHPGQKICKKPNSHSTL